MLVQTCGKKNGCGDLIKLHAGPVGFAVDPGVLRKAAVEVLDGSEPNQRPSGRVGLSGGNEGRRTLHKVSRVQTR